MIRLFFRFVILFLFLSTFVALVGGCFDEHQPAPVLNAWHQKGAASNFYIVRRGDTIYSIAFSFGLDYRALAAANQLVPPYLISTGQRLRMTFRPVNHAAPVIVRAQKLFYRPIKRVSSRHFVVNNIVWQKPVHGYLLQRFSTNPSGHPGISIGGRLGEPIHAAASGRVVYSGDGVRGYGNLIIIKHNDSYLSAYAFNQQNLVRVGDFVHVGQVIARMGQNDAGRTLLYFEIRLNGVPVNPLLYM